MYAGTGIGTVASLQVQALLRMHGTPKLTCIHGTPKQAPHTSQQAPTARLLR